MNTFLKFTTGIMLGAAIGAGVYVLLSKESDEGVIYDIKKSINSAIEEGRRAAEERRKQLEQELGFSIVEEAPAIQESPKQMQTVNATTSGV